MIEQGSGSIINMSSGAIDTPAPGIVCYTMAKAAVAQLTKTLAAEVGPSGVRVNAIAPGLIVTGMTSRHFTLPDGSIDEQAKAAFITPMAERATLGRVGEPDDIAYAVLYLACRRVELHDRADAPPERWRGDAVSRPVSQSAGGLAPSHSTVARRPSSGSTTSA